MMTCDAIQNRLLGEPDPLQPAAELRAHVKQCAACRDFSNRYETMARAIAALPAPTSELAKLTFTDSLTSAGPIIRSVPALTTRSFSWRGIYSATAKPLAATAAAIAVGLGIWAMVPASRIKPEYVAARHDLLRKVVASNATLAQTTDPKARIEVLTDMAADLRLETVDVVKAAPAEDLNSLATLYESVVNDGLVKQAQQLDKKAPATRHAVLNAAADKLAATMDDMNALIRNAPQQAQPALKRIGTAAEQGRTKLLRIARGEGV